METSLSIAYDPNLKPGYIILKEREIFCFIKNERFHKSDGLATIITKPRTQSTHQSGQANNSQNVAILIHGHLSHKNAIYQPLLAEMLSNLGYLVIRFDFRNQGDSEDNRDKSVGRTIFQDLEDLETVIKCVTNKDTKKFTDIFGENKLSLEMIIAHSRGVLPMFSYFSSLGKKIAVPTLINCCGRFSSDGLLRRYTKMYPNWEKEKGFWTKTFRYGKYTKHWVPYDEIISAGCFSNKQFKNISTITNVVHIYGTRDDVIPLKDAEDYHELFKPNSFIYLISGADHNFYGLTDDDNEFKLPSKRGKVNYSYYLVALLSLASKNNSFKDIEEAETKAALSDITKLLS
ncbi:hypothetical protein MOSE0_M08658 [Monosporozyma servazzii]